MVALGEVDAKDDLACTNKIQIVREIPWAELLTIVNAGKGCTGLWNTGDWNTTNYSSGCFNTIESSIILFDKPSDMTMDKWFKSDACSVMSACPCDGTEWIKSTAMTGQERGEHPEYEITGGYLKVIKVLEADKQKWWDGLKDKERECVKAIPNFDADIFYKCTGIKVGD